MDTTTRTPRADRLAAALQQRMTEVSAAVSPERAARINEQDFQEWLRAVLDPEFTEDALAERAFLHAGARSGLL